MITHRNIFPSLNLGWYFAAAWFYNVLSALRVNHLSLSDGTLQLGNLSQDCVLVGQNVVHLLCNLLLSKRQQIHTSQLKCATQCVYIIQFTVHLYKDDLSVSMLVHKSHFEKTNSFNQFIFGVLPSGLGMPGPLEGFCVPCGFGAVCRVDRAAADRTYSRTAVSPGRAPDKSEPDKRSQIK